MSYYSQHMQFPIAGIRTTVQIVSYQALVAVLLGVEWTTFKLKFVFPHEYGNTKFNDLTIIAYYLKNHFCLRKASIDIGYSQGATTSVKALRCRLKRINAELLNYKDIIDILTRHTKTVSYAQGDKTSHLGGIYKFYAKWYVTSAMVEYDCKKRPTAKRLGISLKTLNYWLNLEVEDIRV